MAGGEAYSSPPYELLVPGKGEKVELGPDSGKHNEPRYPTTLPEKLDTRVNVYKQLLTRHTRVLYTLCRYT